MSGRAVRIRTFWEFLRAYGMMGDDHPKDISTFVYTSGDDAGYSANDDAVVSCDGDDVACGDEGWVELDEGGY